MVLDMLVVSGIWTPMSMPTVRPQLAVDRKPMRGLMNQLSPVICSETDGGSPGTDGRMAKADALTCCLPPVRPMKKPFLNGKTRTSPESAQKVVSTPLRLTAGSRLYSTPKPTMLSILANPSSESGLGKPMPPNAPGGNRRGRWWCCPRPCDPPGQRAVEAEARWRDCW